MSTDRAEIKDEVFIELVKGTCCGCNSCDCTSCNVNASESVTSEGESNG